DLGAQQRLDRASLAEEGLGLAYALEPMVMEQLRTKRLQRVLEPCAPTVPGLLQRCYRRRVPPACSGALHVAGSRLHFCGLLAMAKFLHWGESPANRRPATNYLELGFRGGLAAR